MKDKQSSSIEDRVRQGQSVALGDTGEGSSDVSSDAQGISNRPGDRVSQAQAAANDDDAIEAESVDVLGDAADNLEAADGPDDEGDDDDDEDVEDDEDEDADEDEVNDPEAEPGKPI